MGAYRNALGESPNLFPILRSMCNSSTSEIQLIGPEGSGDLPSLGPPARVFAAVKIRPLVVRTKISGELERRFVAYLSALLPPA